MYINFCFFLYLDYESSVVWAQVIVVPVRVSFLLFLFRLRSWRVVGAVQVILS